MGRLFMVLALVVAACSESAAPPEPPEPNAPLVKLLPAPYRYAAFSPDGKKLLALSSLCVAGDVPSAVLLDAATLKPELIIPGAVWATWRP